MRANVRLAAGTMGIVVVALIGAAVMPFHGHAQTAPAGQAAPAGRSGRGVGANRLLDNERVSVQRLSAAAGLTETMHKSPMDIVAIQATPASASRTITDDGGARRFSAPTVVVIGSGGPVERCGETAP